MQKLKIDRKIYDVAAYVWPAYTGREQRTLPFWPDGIGEWQSVLSAENFGGKFPTPRKPLWGPVDEADPAVMEMEIDAATAHGVNIFIYDWYWYDRRPFLEQCLNDGFLKAKNSQNMRFYLMWANHNATFLWDKRLSDNETVIWQGSQSLSEFRIIARRLIEKYFMQPNYYKIEGCPVFMIYDIMNLIRGFGGLDVTRSALEEFRAMARAAGFPGLHLQLVIWNENSVNLSKVDAGRTGSTLDVLKSLPFDSVTHYQFVQFIPFKIGTKYADLIPAMLEEWDRIRTTYPVPYYPHVSIGWNNTPRFNHIVEPYLRDSTTENFEHALRLAKEYSDAYNKVPLVTINSWNEWTESSYLEPDDVDGYKNLEAVRKVFM